MSKKPFYKRWWFWLIVIGTLLCVANIVCSIIFKGEDGANIFTAVSGWVSGIATAILGVIAVVQNRKYKEDGDDNIKKQYNFEVFKLLVSQREQYVSRIRILLEEFAFKYDYKRIIPIMEEIGSLYHSEYRHFKSIELKGELNIFYQELNSQTKQLLQMINNDAVLSEERTNILDGLRKYESKICRSKFFDDKLAQIAIDNLCQQIEEPYEKLVKNIKNYLDYLDDDLIKTITEKSLDIDYINTRYIKQREQNNG